MGQSWNNHSYIHLQIKHTVEAKFKMHKKPRQMENKFELTIKIIDVLPSIMTVYVWIKIHWKN